ncbi:MAG: DUF971 domain-containing protein [Deltaproteobacteria bacterium]|nr:DUF971 domain-containing protein [Deltaproteobacteria bacterium]
MKAASPAPEPTGVELVASESRMRVTWAGGHVSDYPLRYLRGFCPCAQCQGHSTDRWTFVPNEQAKVVAIEEVGHYALNVVWEEGGRRHTTGIYSFDVLRTLCPCDACQAALGAAHPMRVLFPGSPPGRG